MALVDNVISIDFGQGVDTKTDPKLVVSGKLLSLQNGIFTNTKRVTKRNGYTALTNGILGGGTISNPTMCRSYKNELLVAGTTSGGAANGNRLFSYSSSLGKWVDKGKYNSVAVSKMVVDAPSTGWTTGGVQPYIVGLQNSSSAVVGNFTAVGFEPYMAEQPTPFIQSLYTTITDNQCGTYVLPMTPVTSAYGTMLGYSKVVALGSSRFAIFYIATAAGTPKLCYQTITVSGSGVTFGAEVQLVSSPQLGNNFSYDVVSMSTGCFVAVAHATNSIEIYKIDTSGSVTISSLVSVTATCNAINVTLDSTQTNAWIYWATSAAVRYMIYNATTLVQVLADTSIAATGGITVHHVTGVPISATQQTVLYSQLVETAASSYNIGILYPEINKGTVTSGGVVSGLIGFLNGVDIYSKPFTVNGTTLIACVAVSQTNPVGVLIDVSDAMPVAKFLPGEAEGVYSQGYSNYTSYTAPAYLAIRHPGFLGTVQSISGTQFSLASGFVVSLTDVIPLSTSNLATYPSTSTSAALMGVCLIVFDFNNADSFQGIVQQDTLLLNGGFVSQYDSQSVTELGFTVDPDNLSAKAASAGGSIGNGSAANYLYYLVYEWTDGLGNVHVSAPSNPITVHFTSGSSNSVNIYWNPLTITQKSALTVTAKLYRTIANGTIPFLVGVATNTGVFFADTLSDASIQGNEQLYTQGGAILENIAPPPAMIMWTNNNRAWCVDSENPETLIQYSKTASQGSGVAFSSGLLEYVVDSKKGKITGVSPMDEKTLVLKENGAGYFIGDGANDAGTGSSLTAMQFIPSDVGCSNSKSVILLPEGVLFRASNNKGIYIVSRGVQVSYFGFEVESFNSQDITSAMIVSNKNQVRFLTSSGSSLLFDYVMNQWSTFTNHAGLSADTFQGLYTYVRTDGSIYQEDVNSFQDNGTDYALSLQTAWLDLSSVQNFERVRWSLMLGDYANGVSAAHGLQIQAAYNFSSSFSSAVQKTFGAASSSGVFQYRNFFSTQKCDSLTLLITEITSGNSGESMDLSNMTLVAALKRGSYKVGAAASVG